MAPTRKELRELIDNLAFLLMHKNDSGLFSPYRDSPSQWDLALAARVNAALSNPPIIEEKVMSMSIEVGEDWLIHLAKANPRDDDWLNYLAQVDREHEGGLTAQEDEQNDHIGVQ